MCHSQCWGRSQWLEKGLQNFHFCTKSCFYVLFLVPFSCILFQRKFASGRDGSLWLCPEK